MIFAKTATAKFEFECPRTKETVSMELPFTSLSYYALYKHYDDGADGYCLEHTVRECPSCGQGHSVVVTQERPC